MEKSRGLTNGSRDTPKHPHDDPRSPEER